MLSGRHVENQPFLISQLPALAAADIAFEPVQEGLDRHAWSDSELAEIEHDLAGFDIPSGMRMRQCESQAFQVKGFDLMRAGKDAFDPGSTEPGSPLMTRPIAQAWIYQNEIA